jgi:hypothetical protein
MAINKAAKILTSALIGSFVCFLGIANIGFSLAEWQKWGAKSGKLCKLFRAELMSNGYLCAAILSNISI